LRQLYPGAKFVHICRHPYDVYRSNMHIAREGHVTYQLQDPDRANSYAARFLDNYHAMETAWNREAAQLPESDRVEVRFEDLESRPLEVIRQVYQHLGLAWSGEFERRLRAYLEDQADYRKNTHRPLEDSVRASIDRRMHSFLDQWGYRDGDDRQEPRAA
jgi:hypothetical protein